MRLLTDAVLAQARSTGRRVGDAAPPASDTRPYAVLWPLYAADWDGPLDTPDVDAWYRYQLTCVADTREQAQGLADDLMVTMRNVDSYTWSGFVAQPVVVDDVLPVERDDDIQPPVFYQSFTISMFVTPA